MYVKFISLLLSCQILLCGCSWLHSQAGYRNDPFTGGINTGTSELLNVPLPAGLQRYVSHGYSSFTTNGREGLETLRGNINSKATALAMFNTLNSSGWQLRMSARKGERAVYLYEKNMEYALLSFHPQGLLTIIEIWAGPRLPDGATLSLPPTLEEDNLPSIVGEEYGPMEDSQNVSGGSSRGKVETWGQSSAIEEKEL